MHGNYYTTPASSRRAGRYPAQAVCVAFSRSHSSRIVINLEIIKCVCKSEERLPETFFRNIHRLPLVVVTKTLLVLTVASMSG